MDQFLVMLNYDFIFTEQHNFLKEACQRKELKRRIWGGVWKKFFSFNFFLHIVQDIGFFFPFSFSFATVSQAWRVMDAER